MDFKCSTIVGFKLIKIKLRKALQTFCMCGLCGNHGTNVEISLFLTQQSFKTLTQYKSRQFGGPVSILGHGRSPEGAVKNNRIMITYLL